MTGVISSPLHVWLTVSAVDLVHVPRPSDQKMHTRQSSAVPPFTHSHVPLSKYTSRQLAGGGRRVRAGAGGVK